MFIPGGRMEKQLGALSSPKMRERTFSHSLARMRSTNLRSELSLQDRMVEFKDCLKKNSNNKNNTFTIKCLKTKNVTVASNASS